MRIKRVALLVMGTLICLGSAGSASAAGDGDDQTLRQPRPARVHASKRKVGPHATQHPAASPPHRRVGSSNPPAPVAGPDQRASQRAVCQSQCNLERMTCDQGRNGFINRSDQIRAAQSSCYLAVQSCLGRC